MTGNMFSRRSVMRPVIFMLAVLLAPPWFATVRAQISVLGKDANDQFLARFWNQNLNASNLVRGVSTHAPAGTTFSDALLPALITSKSFSGTFYGTNSFRLGAWDATLGALHYWTFDVQDGDPQTTNTVSRVGFPETLRYKNLISPSFEGLSGILLAHGTGAATAVSGVSGTHTVYFGTNYLTFQNGVITAWNSNTNMTGAGILSLNGDAATDPTFATGAAGVDFSIHTASGVTTFHLPNAAAGARGALTSADWTTFNGKQPGSAMLTAVSAASGNGFLTKTGTSSVTTRQLTAGDGITIDYPDGVTGNPSIAVNPAELTDSFVLLAGGTMTGALTLSGAPSSSLHAVTKAYVDSVAQGVNPKPPVAAATTGNITLSGEQTLDGVLTSASRVLVKNQSTASQNGIYVSAAGAWSRAADMDAWDETVGAFVFVSGGTTQGSTGWASTTETGGTLGATEVAFVQMSAPGAYTAGSGLTLSGDEFSLTPLTASQLGSGTANSGSFLRGDQTWTNKLEGNLTLESPSGARTLSLKGGSSGTYLMDSVSDGLLYTDRTTLGLYAATSGLGINIINGDGISFFTGTQNAKISNTGLSLSSLTASRAVVTDGTKNMVSSPVTSAELGHLSGVTSAVQTQLNGKQPLDATLTALASLATGANKMPYSTGTDTFAQADLTAFARTILDDADAATVRATIGAAAGAASSTDNAIARFDGTTGKVLQNSAVTVDDNGKFVINSDISWERANVTWPISTTAHRWSGNSFDFLGTAANESDFEHCVMTFSRPTAGRKGFLSWEDDGLTFSAAGTLALNSATFTVIDAGSDLFLWSAAGGSGNTFFSGANAAGTSAKNVIVFGGASVVAPTTSPENVAQLWVGDAAGAGTASLHVRDETGQTTVLGANGLGKTYASYAAGTAAPLPNAAAQLNFGTTDPGVTLTLAGTYRIDGSVSLEYNGATFGANQTVTLKLRKTSGTAADVANSTRTFKLDVVTTETSGIGVIALPPVTYTAAANDVIELWAHVGALPSAGSVDAVAAEIFAQRIQ